jgi:hypothetical protein
MIDRADKYLERWRAAPVPYSDVAADIVHAMDDENAVLAALRASPPDPAKAAAALKSARAKLAKATEAAEIDYVHGMIASGDYGETIDKLITADAADLVTGMRLAATPPDTAAAATKIKDAIADKEDFLRALDRVAANPPKANGAGNVQPPANGKKGRKGTSPSARTHSSGAIRAGVYTASGADGHIKLTVSGHAVEVTYGTSFEQVCAGPITHNFQGRSPVTSSISFHPGFGFHPIDARGHFRIIEHEKVLEGRFVGSGTIIGTFHSHATGECRGDHSFTLTTGGGTIGPLQLPVLYGTYGHFLVKKALLPEGYDYQPSYGYAHPLDPNAHGLSWNVIKGLWYDDATGAELTKPIGRDPSKWTIGSSVYTLMVKEALPSGYTLTGTNPYRATGAGGAAAWDVQTQTWESASTHAALSKSGLGWITP